MLGQRAKAGKPFPSGRCCELERAEYIEPKFQQPYPPALLTMNHYVTVFPESVKRAMERLEMLLCTHCAPGKEAQVV
jgi:hypothetical protein